MLRLTCYVALLLALGCADSVAHDATAPTDSPAQIAPSVPARVERPVSVEQERPPVIQAPTTPSVEPVPSVPSTEVGVGVFRGVSRELSSTALGHQTAVSCHNCYVGPGNEPLPLEAANARIAKAIAEGADFIEIDVVEIRGRLYAGHSDLAEPGILPLLSDLFAAPALRNSDALVVIEIKESQSDALTFSRNLLAALNETALASEGRPLFFKAFSPKLNYLLAIKEAATALPRLAPYLRYYVLHSGLNSIAAWQQEIDTQIVANGLDGIDVFFRAKHLAAVSGYARSLGLGVGVWTVPGPKLGQLAILALREQSDIITTDLPLDQARALLVQQDVRTHLDASDLDAVQNLTVYRSTPLIASRDAVLLDASAPVLERGAMGDVMFGGALRFAEDKALTLPAPGASSAPGFMVSALVRFNTLELAPNQTMPILAQLDDGAFRFELTRSDTGQTELRFGVNVDGALRFQTRPVAGDANATCDGLSNAAFFDALDTDHAYLLTGLYAPDGRVFLFINLQCAGRALPGQTGNIKASQAGVRIGRPVLAADPHTVAFDGSVQRMDMLDWVEPQ